MKKFKILNALMALIMSAAIPVYADTPAPAAPPSSTNAPEVQVGEPPKPVPAAPPVVAPAAPPDVMGMDSPLRIPDVPRALQDGEPKPNNSGEPATANPVGPGSVSAGGDKINIVDATGGNLTNAQVGSLTQGPSSLQVTIDGVTATVAVTGATTMDNDGNFIVAVQGGTVNATTGVYTSANPPINATQGLNQEQIEGLISGQSQIIVHTDNGNFVVTVTGVQALPLTNPDTGVVTVYHNIQVDGINGTQDGKPDATVYSSGLYIAYPGNEPGKAKPKDDYGKTDPAKIFLENPIGPFVNEPIAPTVHNATGGLTQQQLNSINVAAGDTILINGQGGPIPITSLIMDQEGKPTGAINVEGGTIDAFTGNFTAEPEPKSWTQQFPEKYIANLVNGVDTGQPVTLTYTNASGQNVQIFGVLNDVIIDSSQVRIVIDGVTYVVYQREDGVYYMDEPRGVFGSLVNSD